MPPNQGWQARHQEVLGRWPVVREPWAMAIEERRLTQSPAAPTGKPPNSDNAITPKEAMARVFAGSADDHDEVRLLPGG